MTKGLRRRWVAPLVALVVLGGMGALGWSLTLPARQVEILLGLGVLVALVAGLVARFAIRPGVLARRMQKRLASLAPADSRHDYLQPGELPPPPAIFEGREDDFKQVIGRLQQGVGRRRFVMVIHGEAGVGKSGLAVKVATAAAKDFPSGVVYASLTDARPGTERYHQLLGELVDSLGTRDDTVPSDLGRRVELWRRLTRGRRGKKALYVLDDAADAKAIEDILPARGAVLITSRDPLATLHQDVEPTVLEPLGSEFSAQLLEKLLGERIPAQGPIRDAFSTVVASAHGYPFALHLAARAISGRGLWALPDITAQLSPTPVKATDEEVKAGMLDLTYAVLEEGQQRALLALSYLHQQTFYPWMLEAMADISENEAWRTCDALADHRLLERVSVDATGVLQLRIPDRVWEYITAKAARVPTVDRETAQRALAARERSQTAMRLDEKVAAATERLHRGEVGSAIDEARGALAEARRRREVAERVSGELSDDERAALAILAEALAEVGGLDDARELATLGLSNATPTDAIGAHLGRTLGLLRRRSGQLPESVSVLAAAAAAAQAVGDVAEQVACLREQAVAEATAGHQIEAAEKTLATAFNLAGAGSTPSRARLLEARALWRLNKVRAIKGPTDAVVRDELDLAIQELVEAARILPAAYRLWRAWFEYHLALLYLHLATGDGATLLTHPAAPEDLLQGRLHAQAALDMFSHIGHKYGIARCRLELGRADRAEGNHPLARTQFEEARETLMLLGDRWLEARTAMRLGELRLDQAEQLDHAEEELRFAVEVFGAAGNDSNTKTAQDLLNQVRQRRAAADGTLVSGGVR